MKILYLTSAAAPDYQADMLFHGLVSLGHEVTDVNRLWYMYREEVKNCDRSKLYGKGFSLYGLLSEPKINRSDVLQRIKNKQFDLVIFGSIQRCQSLLGDVESAYPPNKIAFVDGEDHVGILSGLIGRGFYFKRELASFNLGAKPIHFAIPREKVTLEHEKHRVFSYIDPRVPKTYIYDIELEYYRDYAHSLYGATVKKGGWDCLRHYEILANMCMPYFIGLEDCPQSTLVHFPKAEILFAKSIVDNQGEPFMMTPLGLKMWKAAMSRALTIFDRHSTTEKLAEYVLRTVESEHVA